jgi:hypothetical protein
MDIIGLGEAGCNIAECFRKYPQYSIYKIDVGEESDFDFINHYDDGSEAASRYFSVRKQNSAEDYERNAPDLTQFFRNLRDEVIFIVGGLWIHFGHGPFRLISTTEQENFSSLCETQAQKSQR